MIESDPSIVSLLRLFILCYRILLAFIEVSLNAFKNPERKSVRGQNVLITGAGHGLGRELALKFARLGANLILVDINEKDNASVKEEITNLKLKSCKCLTYSVDIREEKQVAELAEKVRRDLGDIDILVNNAGIVQCLPLMELSPNLIERTFQVNVISHLWTIRHFLPSMIKKNRGHIVAVSSIAGLVGAKYLVDYCASKYAVIGLMNSLNKEIHDGGANPNVHVTTICPSGMTTGMFQTITTRFSWLMPVLTADQVANLSIEAILTNKPIIVLPSFGLFLLKLQNVLPTKVAILIQEYLDYGVMPHKKVN